MKVKAHKLQYEIRKLKERNERKHTLDARIYPVVWIAQRRPYIHVVEALTKSIASGNHVSSVNTITVTFILLSTKELLHRGWGSPRPPHKIVDAALHQAGGSKTCRRATNAPRGQHTDIHLLVHYRTSHKAETSCSLTHLRANLALTLIKLC